MTVETHGPEVRVQPSLVKAGDLVFADGDWRQVLTVTGSHSAWVSFHFLVELEGGARKWVKRRTLSLIRARLALAVSER